jgi:hypothetical protein
VRAPKAKSPPLERNRVLNLASLIKLRDEATSTASMCLRRKALSRKRPPPQIIAIGIKHIEGLIERLAPMDQQSIETRPPLPVEHGDTAVEPTTARRAPHEPVIALQVVAVL